MFGCKYNLLIKDTLSIKDKCFNFVLVPKCPLFRGSLVYSSSVLYNPKTDHLAKYSGVNDTDCYNYLYSLTNECDNMSL